MVVISLEQVILLQHNSDRNLSSVRAKGTESPVSNVMSLYIIGGATRISNGDYSRELSSVTVYLYDIVLVTLLFLQ